MCNEGQAVKYVLIVLLLLNVGSALAADRQAHGHAGSLKAPQTVSALWANFDPRQEQVAAKTVREWKDDGITYRYVTFHIGTFQGRKARMAAFYAFPQSKKKLPGLLHLHGGGQRAFLHEVQYYAKRGYACLSINWGGRQMEDAKPGDPNTDWGAVDPTQKNVPGYFNLKPGDKYLDPFESPRNNNWYLLTIGARRGLTFLEQQEEVDPKQLGVYGHSMGGNLTVYVAGSDNRIKVAAPSAGGQGFRTVPWKLLPEQRRRTPNGDMELFRATLGFQSYAKHIKAPLLWLGATNDFHGIMDDTYRTGDLIPGEVRYAFAPHLNHRFTPEFAVTRPLWIDQHLKGTVRFPGKPISKLILNADDRIPRFEVKPDSSMPVERVEIMYSVDPDPQARFWRTADATSTNNMWSAQLPIMSTGQPLFAFANVFYRLVKPEAVQFAKPTSTFALSSSLHTATPKELRGAKLKSTDKPSLLIDDFSSGWQDWHRLSADNPHHWQYWTRKINDPKWRGRDGYQLSFDVKSEKPNELVVVMTENSFRSYRGKQQDFVAVVGLKGGADVQSVKLTPADFKRMGNGEPLKSWQHVDLLGFRAYHEQRRGSGRVGSNRWAGSQPEFRNLRWRTNNDLTTTTSFRDNGVTAHRGNSSEFPENTVPAFESGIEVGADWIELDILRTKDGKLVVIHDLTTKRVGDQNLVVAKSSYEELAKVDVASDFRRRSGKTIAECPPQQIPLLKDVLRLVMNQGRTRVSIQPKMNCVADVVALVKAMKAERWVGFNDGNLQYMAEVKRLAPKVTVFWDRGKDTNIDEDIRIAKKHGFEALVLHYEGVTPEKIKKIKSAGIEIGAWTVNDRATMKRLLESSVERLYTDHPRLLLTLKSKKVK
jgi:glycerophosphoryl diester phosphodiesterase/dienelactone hydrolase